MSFIAESFENYLAEVLSLPLMHRCNELGILIDRSSTKELQDSFPTLIGNIFGVVGGTGWGFRTITRLNSLQEFDALYHFFVPMGPMFRLCYRLLNESIKFELPIELLPTKMAQMLQSGRYAQFYTDMVQIDPCRRQIVSLSLNAFDYYILHFILHGMVPLHKMYPGAMAVHNENSKTIYFFLVADYLCSFLPSDPNTVVCPTNICSSVKMATSMPIQPIQPTRSPKYLMVSALSQHYTIDTTNIRSSEMPRTFSWRTESILYFTIDCWLRYDVDECRDLPSSEFIRVVRILVKQLHAFGNSADLDNTSMASLRKLAQPMTSAQMYTFLRSIIARWPLDSSFSVVLELWLSYVQPWRYTFGRSLYPNAEYKIHHRFEPFIVDNLISYTQIFVQLLPRFQRLDFSSIKNALMLYRVVKVFSQSNLIVILKQNEASTALNRGLISSPPTANKSFSPERNHNNSFGSNINHSANSGDINNDWPPSFRTYNYINQDMYVHLFGVQIENELKNLITKLLFTKEIEQQRVERLKNEIRQKHKGVFKYLKWFFVSDEDALIEQTLNDCIKIPDILDNIMQSLSIVFEIESTELEMTAGDIQNVWPDEQEFENISSESNNTSESLFCPSPVLMRKRARELQFAGDPALIPIRSNEFTFLVRFLHQVSTKFNLMFSNEITEFWNRNDIWGRLSRQIFLPPTVVHSFDKSRGISMMYEEHLGPRLNLRFIGSYQTFGTIVASFIFGQLFLGVPSFGFLLLLSITFVYIFILSLFNDPK